MSVMEKLARAICEADTTAPKPDEPIYIKMRAAKAWESRVEMARAAVYAMGITVGEAAALMDGSAVVVPVEEAEDEFPPMPTAEERRAGWLRWHRAVLAASQHEETKP